MIDKFFHALPWIALVEAIIFVALFVIDMIFHIPCLFLVAMVPIFLLLSVSLFVACAEDKKVDKECRR